MKAVSEGEHQGDYLPGYEIQHGCTEYSQQGGKHAEKLSAGIFLERTEDCGSNSHRLSLVLRSCRYAAVVGHAMAPCEP